MQYNNTPNNVCKNPIRDLKGSYYLSVKATLDRCVMGEMKNETPFWHSSVGDMKPGTINLSPTTQPVR